MTEWPAGRIFGCVLGDRLRARAAEGDAAAIAIMLRFFPRDLPRAASRALRDEELRRVADHLVGRLPGCGITRASELLALAGELLAVPGRAIGAHPAFAALGSEERDALEADVRGLLQIAGRWPSARQIRNILSR